MKCPTCGETLNGDVRITIQSKEFHLQSELDEWVEMVRFGDVEVPVTRFVDNKDTMRVDRDEWVVGITRTLYDSEWYCHSCWNSLPTRVRNDQRLLIEYEN